MKTAFAGLISRLDTAKGTVTDAEDVSKPTGKEKKKMKKNRMPPNYGTITTDVTHT